MRLTEETMHKHSFISKRLHDCFGTFGRLLSARRLESLEPPSQISRANNRYLQAVTARLNITEITLPITSKN
jgi:hypothetical protein